MFGGAAPEEEEAEEATEAEAAGNHGGAGGETSARSARAKGRGLRETADVLLWEYAAKGSDAGKAPIGLVRATEAATRVLRATAPDGAVEGGGLAAGRVTVRLSNPNPNPKP